MQYPPYRSDTVFSRTLRAWGALSVVFPTAYLFAQAASFLSVPAFAVLVTASSVGSVAWMLHWVLEKIRQRHAGWISAIAASVVALVPLGWGVHSLVWMQWATLPILSLAVFQYLVNFMRRGIAYQYFFIEENQRENNPLLLNLLLLLSVAAIVWMAYHRFFSFSTVLTAIDQSLGWSALFPGSLHTLVAYTPQVLALGAALAWFVSDIYFLQFAFAQYRKSVQAGGNRHPWASVFLSLGCVAFFIQEYATGQLLALGMSLECLLLTVGLIRAWSTLLDCRLDQTEGSSSSVSIPQSLSSFGAETEGYPGEARPSASCPASGGEIRIDAHSLGSAEHQHMTAQSGMTALSVLMLSLLRFPHGGGRLWVGLWYVSTALMVIDVFCMTTDLDLKPPALLSGPRS